MTTLLFNSYVFIFAFLPLALVAGSFLQRQWTASQRALAGISIAVLLRMVGPAVRASAISPSGRIMACRS